MRRESNAAAAVVRCMPDTNNTPSPKPRMPPHVLGLLRDAVDKIDAGPDMGLDRPSTCAGRSDEYMAGMRECAARQDGWRQTWIVPYLRQVLAWADGVETARDIEVYGAGMDHGEDKTP